MHMPDATERRTYTSTILPLVRIETVDQYDGHIEARILLNRTAYEAVKRVFPGATVEQTLLNVFLSAIDAPTTASLPVSAGEVERLSLRLDAIEAEVEELRAFKLALCTAVINDALDESLIEEDDRT